MPPEEKPMQTEIDEAQLPPVRQRITVPFYSRLHYKIEDFVDEINWLHVAFKTCAYLYIAVIAYITWMILPINGHWTPKTQSDKLPVFYQDYSNFFGSFEGFSDCNIRALDLYHKPKTDEKGLYAHDTFCASRKTLLQSLSDGGRIGFDSPYIPHDCYYRWYTVQEICMLLDRFDGVVFVGDDSLQTVYNGFNVLLRQDLALGAVKAWDMNQNARDACRCDRQFNSASCAEHFVKSDQDVKDNTPSIGSPYYCARTLHNMISVKQPETADLIRKAIPHAPRSNYRPIPVVHSTSPSNTNIDSASDLLLTTLKVADDSKRKTPMLWLGPTAAGHLDIKGRKGNQEIWDFDRDMAEVATDNDIEVLKMWNLTVQASSYDGLHFGEKVAITQAMMIVNWLARLESS